MREKLIAALAEAEGSAKDMHVGDIAFLIACFPTGDNPFSRLITDDHPRLRARMAEYTPMVSRAPALTQLREFEDDETIVGRVAWLMRHMLQPE